MFICTLCIKKHNNRTDLYAALSLLLMAFPTRAMWLLFQVLLSTSVVRFAIPAIVGVLPEPVVRLAEVVQDVAAAEMKIQRLRTLLNIFQMI